jgi:hypothetical protein
MRWFKRDKLKKKREIAGPEYFVETFAKLDPSDLNFSLTERLGAFDRAVESAGLSGLIRSNDFDLLYAHYRMEIKLLASKVTSNHPKGIM